MVIADTPCVTTCLSGRKQTVDFIIVALNADSNGGLNTNTRQANCVDAQQLRLTT